MSRNEAREATEKGPRLLRNDMIWESMKEHIRRVYMIENKTLAETMIEIQKMYGFNKSERKWKTKLREWRFEKKLTGKQKEILLAKKEKRAREGKGTIFYHNGAVATLQKIQSFKRQKLTNESEAVSPSAETPEPVTYHTPQNLEDVDINPDSMGETPTVVQHLESHFSGRASRQDSILHTSDKNRDVTDTEILELNNSLASPKIYVFDEISIDAGKTTDLGQGLQDSIPRRGLGDMHATVASAFSSASTTFSLPSSIFSSSNFLLSSTSSNVMLPRTPAFGSDMLSCLPFDIDPFFNTDFDIFPQSPGHNFGEAAEQIQGRFTSDTVTQPSGELHTTDDTTLFEVTFFGNEALPNVTPAHKLMETLPWFQLQAIVGKLGLSSLPVRNLQVFGTTTPHITFEERQKILTQVLIPKFVKGTQYSISDFTAYFAERTPERVPGELQEKIQQLFDPSNGFPANQIFLLVLYFSSNNLLWRDQVDVFLKWVIEHKYFELLRKFLQYKTPTVSVFATRILASAVRIVEPEFVTLLLESSIDARILSGLSGGSLLEAKIRELWWELWEEPDGVDCWRYVCLIKILLENDADPNYSNPGSRSKSLLYAVLCDNREIVELLVTAGAIINNEPDTDLPAKAALAAAVNEGSLQMIDLLLHLGAEVDGCYKYGVQILAWAACKSSRIYMALLSKSQKSRDIIDVPGILHASQNGISCLLDYLQQGSGLPKTKFNELLESAFHDTIRYDPTSSRLVEILLGVGVDPNVPTQGGCPLSRVLYSGALHVADLLLKSGADPNGPGVLKACANNFDALELVISHGADIPTNAGDALCSAAACHNHECIALLIESGADINSRAQGLGGNRTPMQYIAWDIDSAVTVIETAKFLIDNGADVNATAGVKNSYTALQAAAKKGCYELVEYYLDVGADVNAAPAKIEGWTALEAAANIMGKDQEKPKIFHLLIKAGASLNRAQHGLTAPATTSTLHALIETGSVDLAHYAISAGADIHLRTTGKEGRTPLQLAAEKRQLSIVKTLLQKGAEVNAPASPNFGRTALQAAASCKAPCMEIIKLLLEYGAEVNAKPAIVGGVTALQASAIRGHIPIALFLLEKGAEVNAKPAIKDGRIAIEGAAEHGRLDMVQLLLQAGAVGDPKTKFQKAIDAAERNYHFAIVDMLKGI